MARDLARAVAGGSLVKSGIFGGDPSWGRILAALGARIGARDLPDRSGAASRSTSRGSASTATAAPVAFDKDDARRRACGRPRSPCGWTSALGKESARALGCDLTFDYVKINAEYYAGPKASPTPRTASAPPAG